MGLALGGLCPKCVAALAFGGDHDSPGIAAGSPVLTESPGDRIGRYRLVEEIGEGGCGVVYLAEQEEPVRRQVALKVIKLGMDTRQVIARFEAERQVLALMDHPNIAKVFDAGATETGRPFFVMELVKGVPVTRYCDEKHFNTEHRLRLFVQICEAIQHAHQKGIIHRDIKPTNILVADHDRAPVPKIIDFGIAKATTDQWLTDKTLFTAFGQFVGTPAYMSPEQTKHSGSDIDTRSDIYSLGVLLYELLTGRTPFEIKRLLEKGLDGIQRIIREEEPPRPSTRLQTLDAEEQTTVAKNRQSDGPKLILQVRGDLDWIVMKALEKDRSRRYETADGLGMDIQRFLQDEPVIAAAPGAGYKLRKFVRRHRAATTAAGLVLLTLLGGIAGTTWGLQRALRQQREAQHQADIVQQTTDFLLSMFSYIDPQITLQEALDRASPTIERSVHDRLGELQIRRTMAFIYENVGREDLALPHAEAELRLAKTVYGTKDAPELCGAYRHVGEYLRSLGRDSEALRNFEAALQVIKRLHNVRDQQLAAEAYGLNDIGISLGRLGRYEESLANHEIVVAMRQQITKVDQSDKADGLYRIAYCLNRLGRSAEALQKAEAGLAMCRADDLHEVFCLVEFATALKDLGRAAEALPKFEAAYELIDKHYQQQEPYSAHQIDVAKELNYLADCLICLGRAAEALPKAEAAMSMRQRHYKSDHVDVIRSLQTLADCYDSLEQPAKAMEKQREALAILKRMSVTEPSSRLLKVLQVEAFRNLGDLLASVGDNESAMKNYQEGLHATEAVLPLDKSNPPVLALRRSLRARLGFEELDIVVLEVLPRSPAEKIGLRKGDVVTRYAGQKVTSLGRLNQLVAGSEEPDLELEIRRGGKPLRLKVDKGKLGARFVESALAEKQNSGAQKNSENR